MSPKKKPPLSEEDWILIHRMNCEGKKIRKISKKILRPEVTIKRALKRFDLPPYLRRSDWYEFGKYCYAESRKKRRMDRKKIRLKNEVIRQYVKEKLEQKWAPSIISLRLGIAHPGMSISAEAIYDWIFAEAPEYEKYLVRGRYKNKRGKIGCRSYPKRPPKCAAKMIIDARPESANDRTCEGSFEGDLIIGSGGKSCLLTLVNRRTRRVWIRKLTSKDSVGVFWALMGILRTLPEEERRTLTLDNGTEFAKWMDLEQKLGIWVYFCHPYCSFEKGSIENRNGVIRNRFFKKSTNFDDVSHEEVREAEAWINNYPMKVLDGLTPLEDEALNREVRKKNKICKLAA